VSRLGIGVTILITPSPRFREGPPLLGHSRSPAGPGWSLTNELSLVLCIPFPLYIFSICQSVKLVGPKYIH
jgi:hypothetical protein